MKLKLELEFLTQKFGKIPFFCINDTCDDADALDKRLQLVREGMETLLPINLVLKFKKVTLCFTSNILIV